MKFMLKYRRITALAIIASLSIIPTIAAADAPLVIADQRPDYGLPAPYLHKQNGPGYIFANYVFDTLVGQDATGNLVPGLSSNWTSSEDGLHHSLSLSPNAHWHDGIPVTAKDVAFTFEYMKKHPYAFVSLIGVQSVETTDETVNITLNQADAGFVKHVLSGLPILPAHIYSNQENPRHFDSATALTGSGPYKLKDYNRAQSRYVLESVENYHAGKTTFDEVMIVGMAPEIALTELKSGNVDLIPYVPWRLVDQAKQSGIQVLSTPSNHPDRLVFDHEGLFSSLEARHALAHAIDRQALVRIAYAGGALPAKTGYFQPNTPWFDEEAQIAYPHDLDLASQLFETAGFEKNPDGKWATASGPVTLRFIASGRHERPATVIADQLEAFGFTVQLKTLERGTFQEAIHQNIFDLALLSNSTMGDPSALAERVFGKSWRSDGFLASAKDLHALTHAQGKTIDPEARGELLSEFQHLYAEQLPSLMLANPIWSVAHSERITPNWFTEGVAVGIPSPISKAVLLE